MEPNQHPPIDQHDAERNAENTATRPNSLLLPLLLIVRPGVFFRAWGQHAPMTWVIGACWVIGIGSMSTSILNRMISPSANFPISIDSWTMLWAVLLATGMLRGLGVYWIGGAWFRARLWMSGERSKCWKRCTRVYLGGRLVEQTVGVLGLIIYTFTFATLGDFLFGDRFWWLIALGLTALLWGGMVSFLGARAVFTLNAWSWLWLFAVPMLWRLSMTAVGLWVTLVGGPPTLDSMAQQGTTWNEPGTFTYDGSVVNVVLADGWEAVDLDGGVRAVSPDGRATWTARVLSNDSLDAKRSAFFPSDTNPVETMPDASMGRWSGELIQYRNDERNLITLTSALDARHVLLFTFDAKADAGGEIYTDLERCMASAYVVDDRIVGVDASRVQTIETRIARFDVPESWIVRVFDSEPTGYTAPIRVNRIDSPGAAEIQVIVYGDDRSRQEAFDLLFKEVGGAYNITRSNRITRWRGYECEGVLARATTKRGMPIELTMVTIGRPSGMKADIVTLHAPHEPASLKQGLDLFERSIRFTDNSGTIVPDTPADGQP